MPRQDQQTEVTWQRTDAGETPISTRFDDPYFSLDGGLAETAHVFHAGNGLPERLRPGFHIAELGFGTGLNLLATALLCTECQIFFTSFEAYPLTPAQTARALQAFPTLEPLSQPLLNALTQHQTQFTIGQITVDLRLGDAGQTVPHWDKRADAWFLDGFSPAKNPALWLPDLMHQIALHTAPSGTFATYTAAGHVRRSLQAAGFTVQRCPGYGRKRHMTSGRLTAE